MLDEKLTKDMIAFVENDNPTEDDIRAAALIVFKFNHNYSLKRLADIRPFSQLEKIRYEIEVLLQPRLDGHTRHEIKTMEDTLLPQVDSLVADVSDDESDDDTGKKLGKREDHDELPDDIKALWDKNGERFIKMKEAYATCQTLPSGCSRYEYLKILQELYTSYKLDMKKYDAWKPAATDAASEAKNISAARSYISKYRKQYEELVTSGDTEAAKKLADNIQQRVDTLKEANAEISAKVNDWLKQYNFTV